MLNRLKSEELDFTYIGGEFEKIGLARFAEIIKKVGDIWFGDAKDDKALFVMQQYIVLGTFMWKETGKRLAILK